MATQNCSVLLKFFAYPSHYVKSFFLCAVSFFVRMFFCLVESGGVFICSLTYCSINFIIWSFPIMWVWRGQFWKNWKCFCWRLLTLKTGFFRYFSMTLQQRDILCHKTCFLWCPCCTSLVQYIWLFAVFCGFGFFPYKCEGEKVVSDNRYWCSVKKLAE